MNPHQKLNLVFKNFKELIGIP